MGTKTNLSPMVGLLFLLVSATFACSNGDGGDVIEEPDGTGIVDVAVSDAADAADQEPAPPIPVVLIELEEPAELPCNCPLDGWCGMLNEEMEIGVFATLINEPEGEFQGPKKAVLEYVNPEGETVVLHTDGSVEKKDGKDYFVLKAYAEDFTPPPLEQDEGDPIDVAPDGNYELTIRVETDIAVELGDFEVDVMGSRKIGLVVDTTPPQVLGPYEPIIGAVYAAELPVSYCAQDKSPENTSGTPTGVVDASVVYQLVKGDEVTVLEAPEDAALACPGNGNLFLDVAQNNTDTYEFQMVLSDCVGNVQTISVPDVTVVGLPNYEVPEKEPFSSALQDQLGTVEFTRATHISIARGETIYAEDLYPDLALFGDQGIAFALNDGSGTIQPPFMVKKDFAASNGYAWDVNGDLATDLVTLVATETVSVLYVFLQEVKANKEDGEWIPKGTFPAKPNMSIELGPHPFTLMERYDVNDDGFEDLIVAGPADKESMALLLHTGGQVELPDEKYEIPPVPLDDEGEPLPTFTEAPVQEPYFVLHDKTQGIAGITDIYVGQFKANGPGGSLGPPEVATVRPNTGLLSVVSFDQYYKFGSGQDSIFTWGGPTRIARPGDLRRGGEEVETDTSDLWDDPFNPYVEDLVVYAEGTQSLHFVPNKGNGYFDLKNEFYKLANMSWYEGDSQFAGEEGFGQDNVAGTVSSLIGTQPSDLSDWGVVVWVGDEPDTIWLADVMVSPQVDQAGIKDGVMDLIVPVTERNQIAWHPGVSYHGDQDGAFGHGVRANPGSRPRACALADFDLDQVQDIICIAGCGIVAESGEEKQCFCDSGVGALTNLANELPVELALPLGVNWKAGTVTPTHLLTADLEKDLDNDILVVTAPEPQYYMAGTDGNVWNGQWFAEDMTPANLPLVLSYRLEDGVPDSDMPDQSALDLGFGQELSGVTVGDFNMDGHPDLAVSLAANTTSACDGRTVDILIGNRGVTGIRDPLSIGKSGSELSLYESVIPAKGRFFPSGGFLAMQNVTGLMAAQLNLGDTIDDLIVFATEYQTPADPKYQPDSIGTFITQYDTKYNDCAGSTLWPYFDWAPPYPLLAVNAPLCDGPPEPDEGEPSPYICQPSFLDKLVYDANGVSLGQGKASAQTKLWESGDDPFIGVTGDFYAPNGSGADGCIDFLVANKGTDNATFVQGVCSAESYLFPEQIHLFPIGEDPVDIKAADLNQDGLVDAVAALANDVSIMYGKQGGVQDAPFDAPDYLNKGVGYDDVTPTALVAEDVNADGWADLMVTSSSHDSVLVYLNGGVSAEEKQLQPPHRTRFLGPFLLSVGVNPTAILVAPLYTELQSNPDDNCNDIAVLNEGSGSITLLKNRRCKD